MRSAASLLQMTSWGLLAQVAAGELKGCELSLVQAHQAMLAGAVERALATAAAALERNCRDPLALVLSADGFNACGKRVEALELLLQAGAVKSCSPAFYLLPALQLMRLERTEEAEHCLRQGLAVQERAEEVAGNDQFCAKGTREPELNLIFRQCLAQALLDRGLIEDAWQVIELLVPMHEELNGFAAELLLKLDKPDQALPLAQNHYHATGTATSAKLLASCFFRRGDHRAYAEVLRTASAAHPDNVGLASLATQAIFDCNDDLETLKAGWQSLLDGFSTSGPAAELKFLEARQLLLDARFEEGWAAYESRLELPNNQLRIACPMTWNGEPPNGRPVVVVGEQGVGDVLFFARFLPELAAEAGTVFLLVEARLVSLLRRSYPEVVVLEQQELARVLSGEEALWIHLASLPRRYGKSEKNVAAGDSRQLQPQTSLVKLWKERLTSQFEGSLRVGVSLTAGGVAQEYQQRKRDVAPGMVLSTLHELGTAVIDLQHRGAVEDSPLTGGRIIRFEGITRDLDQLCALISQLDLLVTSDQTNAFLGGMLGIPTLAVVPPNPHFMFMRQGSRTPWFSSLRIARARSWADWQSAKDHYCSELETMLSGI